MFPFVLGPPQIGLSSPANHSQILTMFEYTPCDVADALIELGDAEGGFIPDLVQRSSDPSNPITYGPAYTVLYAPKDDPRPAVATHYIDSAPKGSVVVVAPSPSLVKSQYTTALYGGLMSTRAKYLMCAGSVILGRIRDIAEHRALNYPVHSLGVGICAPNKVAKVVAVNVPVKSPSGGPIINPGDCIIGDENGVCVVPKSYLDKVKQLVPPRVKADSLVAEDIKKGRPAAEAQKFHRSQIKKANI